MVRVDPNGQEFLTAIAIGAVIGGVTAAVQGGDLGDIVQGAAIGALVGGASAVAGALASSAVNSAFAGTTSWAAARVGATVASSVGGATSTFVGAGVGGLASGRGWKLPSVGSVLLSAGMSGLGAALFPSPPSQHPYGYEDFEQAIDELNRQHAEALKLLPDNSKAKMLAISQKMSEIGKLETMRINYALDINDVGFRRKVSAGGS